MVIAYSTQADQLAIDGKGRNSPFAAALVKEIGAPGIEIGTNSRRVAADVSDATQGHQLPELSISLIGDFYLNNSDTDVQAWSKLRGSTDSDRLRRFIGPYPSNPLATDIQDRLASLERAEKARIDEAQQAQAERDRLEQERLAKEKADREQQAMEQAERDRLAGRAS